MTKQHRGRLASAPITEETATALKLAQEVQGAVLSTVIKRLDKEKHRVSWLRGYLARDVVLGHFAGETRTVADLERLCHGFASPLTVRSTLNMMVDSGWILKHPHPTDARMYLVLPTEMCRETAEEIAPKVREVVRRLYPSVCLGLNMLHYFPS